jgi:two-component system, chemotaxis family, sensor kinase CheA
MDDLLNEFVAETLETLEALSSEVVAWEADPSDQSRLDAFFRFFHTVKGSCGFLDLPRFLRLSHGAEDVLAAIRNGTRVADHGTVSAVLSVMDRIGALARAVGDGSPLCDDDDDRLLDELRAPSGALEAPAGPADQAEPEFRRSSTSVARSIRLPLALIDQLMNGVSDMVLARNELSRKMRDRQIDAELEGSFDRLSSCVADLRDMISKTRMQRVDRLYAAIPRMVRDLGRELGKSVAVELEGGEVEMDREMVEMVVDPLTHIVRNAMDHGLEKPDVRRAMGKPESGRLRVQARQSGNQIVIEVSDDGRGINPDALVAKAVAAGLINAARAQAMSPAERIELIFEPGLSTAQAVTAISGRGVGMDVVRANIELIGGSISIDSEVGLGTKIIMRVPLTLTIIPGLIIRAGGRHLAIPRGVVVELLHANNPMVRMEHVAGAIVAVIRGERRSMIDLEEVLDVERDLSVTGPRTLLVVRASSGQPYVLGVDSVENNEELVIRPASPLVTTSGLYAGMTLPDNGQPMLLLDASGIAAHADLPLCASPAMGSGVTEDVVVGPMQQMLHFQSITGEPRLLPLAVVDRVEEVAIDQFQMSQGRHFVPLDGQVIPVSHAPPTDRESVTCLRLRVGEETLCYPIERVQDIIHVPEQRDLIAAPDPVTGVFAIVLVDGKSFELIDPFAIFAYVAECRALGLTADASLNCLIVDGDDPWMRMILAPLLRQAGHKVVLGEAGDRSPDVILAGEEASPSAFDVDTPVLRLRRAVDAAAGDESIYRYDRAGLLSALASLVTRNAA